MLHVCSCPSLRNQHCSKITCHCVKVAIVKATMKVTAKTFAAKKVAKKVPKVMAKPVMKTAMAKALKAMNATKAEAKPMTKTAMAKAMKAMKKAKVDAKAGRIRAIEVKVIVRKGAEAVDMLWHNLKFDIINDDLRLTRAEKSELRSYNRL